MEEPIIYNPKYVEVGGKIWSAENLNVSDGRAGYMCLDGREHFVTVRAHTKNEAKVIAWADSCYREESINPEKFSVYPYNPHVLTMANSKTYYAVLTSQIHICDKYDEEDAATKPDLPAG